MTITAIKRAFGELEASEKAGLLQELAASLAETLAAQDAADSGVFAARRSEESRARPWKKVRAELLREVGPPRRRKR